MKKTVTIAFTVAALVAGSASATQAPQRDVSASPLILMSPSIAREEHRAETVRPAQTDERAQIALIGLLTLLKAKNGALR